MQISLNSGMVFCAIRRYSTASKTFRQFDSIGCDGHRRAVTEYSRNIQETKKRSFYTCFGAPKMPSLAHQEYPEERRKYLNKHYELIFIECARTGLRRPEDGRPLGRALENGRQSGRIRRGWADGLEPINSIRAYYKVYNIKFGDQILKLHRGAARVRPESGSSAPSGST